MRGGGTLCGSFISSLNTALVCALASCALPLKSFASFAEVEKATAAMADVHMEDAAPARAKPPAEAASVPARPAPPAAEASPATLAAPPASGGASGAAPMQEEDDEEEGDHAAREAELQRINEELSKADDRCVAAGVTLVSCKAQRRSVHRHLSCSSVHSATGASARLGSVQRRRTC